MKTKTNLKAGELTANHNETLVAGLRVKTSVKAGTWNEGGKNQVAVTNHNETLARGLPVQIAVEAGALNAC